MIADRIRSTQAVSGGGGGGGGATDPYYAYRSLILNFDGNFNDSSPNALAVTDYGDAQIVGDGTFGTVASFDGNGDVLTVIGGSHFNFGSGNFCIECWIKSSQTQQAYAGIFTRSPSGSSRFLFCFDGSGLGLNLWVDAINISGPVASNSTNIHDGNWHHIAAVRSSTSYTIYVDGVAGTSSLAYGTIADSNNPAYIATDAITGTTGTSRKFVGEIGPLRISPWAEYTGPFTPSQDLFPAAQGYPAYDPRNALLLNMDGTPGSQTFVDDSPNAISVTANGNAQIVSDATFGTVASFDGSGDYVDSAANSAFAFGTGDFTVEFWCYPIGSNLFSLYDSRLNETSPNGNGFVIGLNSSLQWVVYQAGNKIIGPTRTLNQWSHIAVVRTGTSVKMYLNGSQIGSTWTTSNSFTDGALLFGTDYPRNARFFNGLLGPTRLTKGIARYTTNFTPPTGPFPAS